MLTALKNLIDNYVEDEERIEALLFPRIHMFI